MADIKLGASAIDGFYVGGTAVDKIYLGNVEVFSSAPPFDSGILENGIFNDSTGVNIPSGGWSVSGGTLNYLTGGAKKVRLNLSTDMIVGNTYDITFTISNAGTARAAWYAGNQNELIEGNTNRGNGTYTISGYTHTVADRGEVSIIGQSSGGGTTFSIDNISIFDVTPAVVNLYDFVNAVSDDDIDSNTGWNATSTFFANSIASTDVGENFSIGIETRSTSSSSTSSITHTLPTLNVGQDYKMTIRYKMDYDAATAPVQNPFFNWNGVTGTTYPSTYSNAGQFVEVEVLFTTTSATPGMKIYPHYNNGTGRTLGDTLEISSIIIEEVVTLINLSGSAANIDSLEANSYGTPNDSEWQQNGATRGIETSEVKSGTYSLSATGVRYDVLNFRPVTSYFTTGNRYRFTFNMKSSEPTAFVQILAGFTNFSGGTTGNNKVRLDDQLLSDVNGWKELIIEAEFTGTLPLINISPRDTSGSSATVYLDEFKIEEL